MNFPGSNFSPATKDLECAHPIPNAWRGPLQQVVGAFCRQDYKVSKPIESVKPIEQQVAEQIRSYISDYGETLTSLPEATWQSSVSQWMGSHWDVLVDLWTVESGESDLVLSVRVFEKGDGYELVIDSIYVP